MDPGALVAAVERALAAPVPGLDARPGRAFVPGALALLVVDGGALAAVALALPPLLRALGGLALRRPLMAVASEAESRPDRADAVRTLGPAVPGATIVVHDPDGPHHFRPGTTSGGVPVELDDVLLEAEVLVTVGPVRRDARLAWTGGAGLVFPGLASRRSRNAHGRFAAEAGEEEGAARRWREAEEARAHVPLDYQICWVQRAGGGVDAWARASRGAEELARRACVPGP